MTQPEEQDRLPAPRRIAEPPAVRVLEPPVIAAADAAEASAVRTSLGTLLAGHVIPDGETIHLLLKPSRWFILFNSLALIAVVTIILIGAQLLHPGGLWPSWTALQIWIFCAAGQIAWSTLQWMGRYYILTDLRAMRLTGVFQVEIVETPLRKVQGVNLYRDFRERLFGLGSIEIQSADGKPINWQTIRRVEKVHQLVMQLVSRARQNGHGTC